MKKLYRVSIQGDIYVLANDANEAEREGSYYIQDESHNLTTVAVAVSKLEQVEPSWHGCYPYNGYGDLTCKQLVIGEDDRQEESEASTPPF